MISLTLFFISSFFSNSEIFGSHLLSILTISFEANLYAKVEMSDLQPYPQKFCPIKYEIDINNINFEN